MKIIFIFFGIGIFTFFSTYLFPKQQTSISTDCSKETGLAKVVCLAEAFKATLNNEQITLLQLEYSKKDAVRWSNFPQAFSRPNRVGLSFGLLNATQLVAAKALMASVLSKDSENEGYDELEAGLVADDFIAKTTGKTDAFGAGKFYIAFLGKPSTTDLWELQYGGHHYAFANTYNKGKIAGATPSFRGIEPMLFSSTNGKKYQPLQQEQEAFSKVIEGLNEKEKSIAKLSFTFKNILLGPGEDGKFPNEKQGIKIGDLNKTQQKTVIKAIELYVNDLETETSNGLMKKYLAELSDTYLSYSGSSSMSQISDYIRIDGPSIWIESSTQPSRDFPNETHIHSVWRDRKTDYGETD